MELLDRYLQAVRFLLPRAQQDDIVKELSADISSQVEDREAERGRPLREDELASLLKQYGHPIVLAQRYRPRQHLIGPMVFPLYRVVLMAALVILGVVSFVFPAIGLLVSREPIREMIPLFRNFPGTALAAFGWITLGFAVLDLCLTRFQLLERWTRDWNPASLPPLAKDVKAGMGFVQEKPASVFGILTGAFFSAWWLAGIKFPYLVLGPVAASLAFGPIWHQLYPLLLFAAAGQVVRGWIRLFRPEWRRFRAVSRVLFDGVDLVVLYLLVEAGNWFIIPVGAEPFPGSLIEMINLATGLGLLLALVCASVSFAWAWLQRGFRFFRGEHDGTPSHVA